MFWQGAKTIYNADELKDHVYNTIKYYEDENKRLREENKQLTEDAISVVKKDYEQHIKYLDERLRLSYGEFASQKELDAYNEFEEEHMHDRRTSRKNGGRAPYLIPTGTGIGTVLKVVCPICGESKDITDMATW